jgi:Domain of unknown function (DUF5615)
MIALYMDENVEDQIVRGLRLRSIDVLTAKEDGYDETPDELVFNRANALSRVVFSRDQDFLREAKKRQENGEAFAGIIYAHKRQVTVGRCIEDLEYMMLAGVPEDFANHVRFIPL